VVKVVVGFANKYLSSRILGKVLPPVGDTSIVLTLFLSGRANMEYRECSEGARRGRKGGERGGGERNIRRRIKRK
jgi:hypothetical protein